MTATREVSAYDLMANLMLAIQQALRPRDPLAVRFHYDVAEWERAVKGEKPAPVLASPDLIDPLSLIHRPRVLSLHSAAAKEMPGGHAVL